MDREKREIRQLKREIKRAGGKLRRRQLKQGLADHPEGAHEDRPDMGRLRSVGMNGIDQDASRRRTIRDEELEATEDRSDAP